MPLPGFTCGDSGTSRERDRGGLVASEEVAQTLADSPPDLIAIGSRVVLKPDGECVTPGLQHLIAPYARGFLGPGPAS